MNASNNAVHQPRPPDYERVVMIRPTLTGLPWYDCPPGFRIRWYRSGDEEHWVRIHQLADHYNKASLALFENQFGGGRPELGLRMAFLEAPDGRVVGTAAAWWSDSFRDGVWGRVHWVAIEPNRQGKGLSKPLLAAVCLRLRELGHERAYLTTATVRIPAINLYLRFGFVPDARSPRERAAWERILPALRIAPRLVPGDSDRTDMR